MFPKFITLLIITYLLVLPSCALDAEENLPADLKKIPTAIQVEHNKKYVYAIPNTDDPEIRGRYKWHFTTSVSTAQEDLKIIEFGAYIWMQDHWELGSIYNRPFNADEFEKWYGCKNALLKPGGVYTDYNNWSKGDQLSGLETRVLWYFIANDSEGKPFKGYAEIVTVGKLKD